ncbi:hypothetical protein ACEWY4_006714 [Coilia grayii]|uniref:LDLRAD1-like C-terminal domain-containing protein n=1 Tax=Coilia grayii TaxID=363190 RepID=A0ABD1KE87_9TELE
MKSNRTYPQKREDNQLFRPTEVLEEDCCVECCSCHCCSRRTICVSALVLTGLALSATGVTIALVFAVPKQPPVNRECRTSHNGSGFLCDDRITCLPPSVLCDGVHNCPSGADESRHLCSDLPNNLPSNLVFWCGNSQFWIFVDKKCNRMNDCGDCSDEIGIYADCPPCGSQWWPCTPVEFQYCLCIPRSLCKDGRQHCYDWSDEYVCTGG